MEPPSPIVQFRPGLALKMRYVEKMTGFEEFCFQINLPVKSVVGNKDRMLIEAKLLVKEVNSP